VARSIPQGHSRVMPYLHYLDPNAALAFLEQAFGFRTRYANRDETGLVRHAQVGVGETTFMLGPARSEFRSAAASALPALHASIWCYVDDVDAHHRRARAAGARILREPADQPYGVREYDALDCEGQEWYFVETLDAGRIAPRPARKTRRARPAQTKKKAAKRKRTGRKPRRR